MSNAVKIHRREVGRLAAGTDSEGRRSQPVCDNCLHMTVRQTGSGNHRHCDLMSLYIPDEEMFPTCDLHTRMNATSRHLAKKGGAL